MPQLTFFLVCLARDEGIEYLMKFSISSIETHSYKISQSFKASDDVDDAIDDVGEGGPPVAILKLQ